MRADDGRFQATSGDYQDDGWHWSQFRDYDVNIIRNPDHFRKLRDAPVQFHPMDGGKIPCQPYVTVDGMDRTYWWNLGYNLRPTDIDRKNPYTYREDDLDWANNYGGTPMLISGTWELYPNDPVTNTPTMPAAAKNDPYCYDSTDNGTYLKWEETRIFCPFPNRPEVVSTEILDRASGTVKINMQKSMVGVNGVRLPKGSMHRTAPVIGYQVCMVYLIPDSSAEYGERREDDGKCHSRYAVRFKGNGELVPDFPKIDGVPDFDSSSLHVTDGDSITITGMDVDKIGEGHVQIKAFNRFGWSWRGTSEQVFRNEWCYPNCPGGTGGDSGGGGNTSPPTIPTPGNGTWVSPVPGGATTQSPAPGTKCVKVNAKYRRVRTSANACVASNISWNSKKGKTAKRKAKRIAKRQWKANRGRIALLTGGPVSNPVS
ncbi:MAG: hypothetical protein Q8Q52_01735 [Acidimicrobiia bacterium]|nr:hypothetical protein [Acidimicrobiia bacterium]